MQHWVANCTVLNKRLQLDRSHSLHVHWGQAILLHGWNLAPSSLCCIYQEQRKFGTFLSQLTEKSAVGKRCHHTWSWHLVMSEGQTSIWWRRIIHSGNNTRFSPPYCIHTLAHNALQARVTQKTQYTITTHLSHVSPVFHETPNFIFI